MAGLTFAVCVLWWLVLLVVGVGSQWWAPLAQLKASAVWGGWTVDRILASGALATVIIAIVGPWLMRHGRRPPQLILLLRDFQSRDVAQLAAEYVRRHGAAWGYWVTLENADFRAAQSLGGDAEVVDDGGRGEPPPVGAWWATSLFLGLVFTAILVLAQLDSALMVWMRETARALGEAGEWLSGVGLIVVLGLVWYVFARLIRWLIVTIQRAALLPPRIETADLLALVMETLLERIRRRASTLTLGPLPVISVTDAFWQDAVLRCVHEARMVVFVIAARESTALDWEFAQVRRLMPPERTLFVRLTPGGMALSNGAGEPLDVVDGRDRFEAIDAAVRAMLTSTKSEPA